MSRTILFHLVTKLIALSFMVSCGPRFKALNTSSDRRIHLAQINSAELNSLAIAAVSEPWAEQQPRYCSRFVRQIFEKYFKFKGQLINIRLFGNTALETESLWQKAGAIYSLKDITSLGGLRPGDILFQDYEDQGHVGVVVSIENQLYVAENTVRFGYERSDFRSITALQTFGRIRSVGRL